MDDAGHDKKLKMKMDLLERINEAMEKAVSERKIGRVGICITGDHSTLMRTGEHTFEPVPFAITKLEDAKAYFLEEEKEKVLERISARDDVRKFDELSAGKGALGRFIGSETMGVVRRFMQVV